MRTRHEQREAALQLPLECEDLPGFVRRVDLMIRTPGSFIYIDTSFLMWLMKVGSLSRAEFFAWLKKSAGKRIAIPVWALHELYRHHSNKRLTEDLSDQINKLEAAITSSFPIFWTIFDEPLNGAASVEAQRNEASDTLRAVRKITERAGAWATIYDRNAREVIEFANAHAVRGGALFDEFASIEGIADARFTGRIPPGFKDKHKKEVEDEDGAVLGSNHWGDLMFWREILEHAQANRARNAIILTKDVKNDWRMAGSLPVGASAEPNAPGVQPPHPMLSFEATRRAGVRELILLDQRLVADLMASSSVNADAFLAAARPPSLPPAKTEGQLRKEAREREEQIRERVSAGVARESSFRFADPEGLHVSKAILQRAVFESRPELERLPTLEKIQGALQASSGVGEVTDLLTADVVAELGANGLVRFARDLLIVDSKNPQRRETASELASGLETYPTATATSLYMGLLAGTYLDEKNRLLTLPRAAVAEKIFEAQQLGFAALPLAEIAQRAAKSERLPLYLPSPKREPISIEFKIDTELDRVNALRAIRIDNHNLLIDVQSDRRLRIADRINDAELSLERLLEHVAELYVLPRGQLVPTGTLLARYSFDEHLGFRDPEEVWREGSREKIK